MDNKSYKKALIIIWESFFNCIQKIEDREKINKRTFTMNTSIETIEDAFKSYWGPSSEGVFKDMSVKVNTDTQEIISIFFNIVEMRYKHPEYDWAVLPEKQFNKFFKKRIIKIYDKKNGISQNDTQDLYDFFVGIINIQKWEKTQKVKSSMSSGLIIFIVAIVIITSIIGMCDGGTYYRGVRVN